jgi:poly-gamma-glutamate synthesis protein (capsule biosynthesis protein)
MQMSTINWQNGTWENPHGENPVAEVIISGDWAPIRAFSDIILADPEAVYGDLLPVLRNSHLRITNLECPLVDEGQPIHKSGAVLKGVPDHIRGLTTVPFEVATMGNNHVFDFGTDAFVRTRDLLERNGIGSAGAGLNLSEAATPLRLSVKGVDIALVSFSEGEDLTAAANDKPGVFGWDVDRVVGMVEAMRPEVHVILVICHGGVEYIPFPPPYLAQALQRIAAAGADLIIGHHPHVPQGLEIHKNVPICYSLGNFVFYQPTDLQYRKLGYLVKAGLTTGGVTGLRIIPYEIGPERLALLDGKKRLQAFKLLETLSAPLVSTRGILDAWHGFLKHYGVSGFKQEMAAILERFDTEPPKGAAMFRNRLTTLQHSHHFTDLMTRIMDSSLEDAPLWSVALVADYFTRRVSDGLPE